MKAAIICVGTEILMGSTLNTHSQFLSLELSEVGIPVYYHGVVGDNPDRLREMLSHYYETVDLIILSGGLGPTDDDLTKEIVCEHFGVELVFDEAVHSHLVERFKRFGGRQMTQNNLKQCYVPKEGITLHNARGTAPGCIVEKDGKRAILLPGPPSELIPMFKNQVKPLLEKWSDGVLNSRYLRFFGIGESALETELKDLFDNQSNPTLATYAKTGEVMLRVTAFGKTLEETEPLLIPMLQIIEDRVGQYLYSRTDEDLEQVLVKALKKAGKTIAFAESCTGGLIASKLVSVAGSSSVFGTGIVAYANEAKMKLLGVREETLTLHGAVSQETAREMTEGLLAVSGADLCVSVTGIAGPEGGTDEKPVGLVYLDLYDGKQHDTYQLNLTGDRERIRYTTTLNALYKSLIKIWCD